MARYDSDPPRVPLWERRSPSLAESYAEWEPGENPCRDGTCEGCWNALPRPPVDALTRRPFAWRPFASLADLIADPTYVEDDR